MLRNETLIDDPIYGNELIVLDCIIEQLNKFAYTPAVARISKKLIKILNGENVDLGTLRTQISKIYQGQNSTLFDNALFSLLLILAKYNPTNRRDEKSGELECAISLENIKPTSRLLTTSGAHFDRDSMARWLNVNNTNPCTKAKFTPRETSYLHSRLIDPITPEIPYPVQPKLSFFGRYINYAKKQPSAALLGGILGFCVAIGLLIGISTVAFPVIGAGMLGVNLLLGITGLVVGPLAGVCLRETALKNCRRNKPNIPANQSPQLLNRIQM